MWQKAAAEGSGVRIEMTRIKKKLLPILLVSFLAIGMVSTGCGKDDSDQSQDQSKSLSGTVNIVTQNGAGEEVLGDMPDGYDVQTYKSNDEVVDQIQNANIDLAIVSANTAAQIYNQTDGKFVAISPVALNDWYIVSNNGNLTSQNLTGLKYKTIVATNQGGTGQYVLQKLLEDSNINPDYQVTMKWVDTPSDVLSALKTSGTVALLQEPFVSQALSTSSDNSDVTSDIDLGTLWESQYGSPIPSDVLIASKDFVKNRGDDLDIFISDVIESIDSTKKTSNADLVFYNSSRGMDILRDYFALMEDLDAVGGKSLNSTFYYGIGE